MAVIKWDPSLEIGERVIDSQHKQLLAQINKLYESFMKHEQEKVIGKIIEFLSGYIDEHLDYEEKFMEKNEFLGLKQHKMIHQGFIVKYGKFKKKLMLAMSLPDSSIRKQTLSSLAIEVQSFLGEWWIDHISTLDQKYAEEILRKE